MTIGLTYRDGECPACRDARLHRAVCDDPKCFMHPVAKVNA